MSSADNIEADDAGANLPRCASCGKSELDGIKLTECADCKSVQYCSDECKEIHQPEHEAICKEPAAELRDEMLFRQPECTHLGDCPICCLPNPLGLQKSALYSCCGKRICQGCLYADIARQRTENMRLACPFCRLPIKQWKKSTRI